MPTIVLTLEHIYSEAQAGIVVSTVAWHNNILHLVMNSTEQKTMELPLRQCHFMDRVAGGKWW